MADEWLYEKVRFNCSSLTKNEAGSNCSNRSTATLRSRCSKSFSSCNRSTALLRSNRSRRIRKCTFEVFQKFQLFQTLNRFVHEKRKPFQSFKPFNRCELSDCAHLPFKLRARRLAEVLLLEGVESSAAKKNLRSHLPGHVLKQVTGDIGKVGVEVGIVGRNTHVIGANEARRGRDLGFAALDPSPAIALKVLVGCQGQVGRMGIPVVRIVPFDAAKQPGDP